MAEEEKKNDTQVMASGTELAEPPIETGAPRIGPPAHVAGGMGAIVSTMKHTARLVGMARGTLGLLRMNQKGGFDCPSCAWPEPMRDRARIEFCENGAKAFASEATRERVTPEWLAAHPIAELGAQSDQWLNDQGRLTEPVVRREGSTHYERISWDDAFALIATELRALGSPDEAAFYTSGRTSNEAAFLYQLFVRRLGTNNLPDCSNMCHESSGAALGATLGVGKGTVQLDDFALADLIILVGQNPGTNHPRMLTTLEEAARNGCTIVSVNPLSEAGSERFQHPQSPRDMLGGGTRIARFHYPVRIGGDQAFFQGVIKAMLEREAAAPGTVLDREFLTEYTLGFEAMRDAIAATPWQDIVDGCGLPRESIEQAADLACRSKATIVCWAMGLTQHRHAVATIEEVVNFLLLRGNMGRPGAGACPVRGHSNVQGDRTMGIFEKMPDDFLDRLGREFSFEPPRRHGHDTVNAIRAMRDGHVKVFVGLGGNFLSATPDTTATAAAMARCRLTVHVSTKLHRGHLVTGTQALILPCLGRSEVDMQAGGPQFVTVENSMSVVSSSEGVLAPAAPTLRSEVAIVAGLARATLGPGDGVDWEAMTADYDRIRERIARVVTGFDDFNARIRVPGGFVLPNGARDRNFRTTTGKANLTTHAIPAWPAGPGQLVMMTIRSHDQYNTTVYGPDDRYRGIHGGRRVILMNAADIRERGLQAGDRVDLTSHFADGERHAPGFVVVDYAIPAGCAATYFPETNVLVPLDSVAERSNTPTSKSVVITVRRAPPPSGR